MTRCTYWFKLGIFLLLTCVVVGGWVLIYSATQKRLDEWARLAHLTVQEHTNPEVKIRAECIASKRCHESGIEFIEIPTGIFNMGSIDGDSDEKPVHSVRVPSFFMSKTEVTVGQYRQCVKAGRCTEPGIGGYKDACNWGKSGREDHPINCVDWGQARTFAKWIGADVDLPTEAEWEYAARGGESFKYAGSNNPDEVAWYTSNTIDKGTQIVGTKRQNRYGLHDMNGNVWEWVLDEYEGSYQGAPSDGSQARGNVAICNQKCDKSSAKRVHRGGCWFSVVDRLRVAIRYLSSPDSRRSDLGFRLRKMISNGQEGKRSASKEAETEKEIAQP